MIYVAILLSLLSLILMGALGLFLWNHTQALKQQIDAVRSDYTSRVQDVTVFAERLDALESTSVENIESVEDVTRRIEHLVQLQANQADEIKRLLRQASASLRFGIEPREPTLLPGPEPTYDALVAGPKTPTPRILPLPHPRQSFRLVLEQPESSNP